MAFDQQKFGPIGGENMIAPAQWSYRSSDDAIADVAASGYFNEKIYQLETGDNIYIAASDAAGLFEVTNDGSDITLTNITDGGGGSTSKKEVSTPYTVLASDEILFVSGTGVVTIPAGLDNKTIYSVDGCSLNAAPENVPALIPSGQSYTLYYRSTTGAYVAL